MAVCVCVCVFFIHFAIDESIRDESIRHNKILQVREKCQEEFPFFSKILYYLCVYCLPQRANRYCWRLKRTLMWMLRIELLKLKMTFGTPM